jgi:hypothetical protein
MKVSKYLMLKDHFCPYKSINKYSPLPLPPAWDRSSKLCIILLYCSRHHQHRISRRNLITYINKMLILGLSWHFFTKNKTVRERGNSEVNDTLAPPQIGFHAFRKVVIRTTIVLRPLVSPILPDGKILIFQNALLQLNIKIFSRLFLMNFFVSNSGAWSTNNSSDVVTLNLWLNRLATCLTKVFVHKPKHRPKIYFLNQRSLILP